MLNLLIVTRQTPLGQMTISHKTNFRNHIEGPGKLTARISAERQRLSTFCFLLSDPMLRFVCYQQAGSGGKWKVIDVQQKYEPLIYPDPDPQIDNLSMEKLITVSNKNVMTHSTLPL